MRGQAAVGHAACPRLCECQARMAAVEAAVAAGADFEQCVDGLSDSLRCAGIGSCAQRLSISERAATLVMSLLKRRVGDRP